MVYVYRSVNSTGALELARALNGVRIKNNVPVLANKDALVCWGSYLAGAQVKSLNNVPLGNKFQDAIKLKEAKVRTIEVSKEKPQLDRRPEEVLKNPVNGDLKNLFDNVTEYAQDFVENENPNFASPVFRRGIIDFTDVLTKFSIALVADANKPRALPNARVVLPKLDEIWVGRTENHKGGNDLLKPPVEPDFYVKKEVFTNEYRVHSFRGKSIRAGKKVHREDFANPSQWIRSWDGGWRIAYDGVHVKQLHRDIAHRAVAALGLDFGAVDIGQKADGTLVVLEVNRAPGIEGGTIDRYKNAIEKWMQEA